jgi:hypothetical protein
MTEAEWLACTDWLEMWDFQEGKVSGRKLRLFGCACCRLIWHLLTDERIRREVEVAERFADGEATEAELDTAFGDAANAPQGYYSVHAVGHRDPAQVFSVAGGAAGIFGWATEDAAKEKLLRERPNEYVLVVPGGIRVANGVSDRSVWLAYDAAVAAGERAQEAADKTHCDLMRDIFGNLFRPSAALPPAVLAWGDSTVRRIAQGIYEERAFGRLPILYDALLDAGCDDEAVLSHCRSDGPHVRGCWVIDLILGKE